MKKCGNLKKWMSKKGESSDFGHDGTIEDDGIEGDAKDLTDREGAKSKKATKNLSKYEKMGKK